MYGYKLQAILLVVLIAITGCSYIPPWAMLQRHPESNFHQAPNQPLNHFHSPSYSPHQIRRVVIVAPFGRQSAYREQEGFTTRFTNELRGLGVFDAVVDQQFVNCDMETIRNGRFDERLVAQLGFEYSADAVLFTELNAFSAYSPMQAAVSFVLVDVRESTVLLAADGTWDMRHEIIRKDFHRFICKRYGPDSHPADAYQHSAHEFMTYVATRMAEHIISAR